MNKVSKAISKFILITATLMCSVQYADATTKEVTLNEFNKAFLDTCGVVENEEANEDDLGKIFFPKDATGDNRQYITYEGNPCYDLKYMVDNKIIQEDGNNVIKFSEGGGVII